MLNLGRALSPSELTVEYQSIDGLGSAFLTLLQCSSHLLQWSNQPLHLSHPLSTPEVLPCSWLPRQFFTLQSSKESAALTACNT